MLVVVEVVLHYLALGARDDAFAAANVGEAVLFDSFESNSEVADGLLARMRECANAISRDEDQAAALIAERLLCAAEAIVSIGGGHG